jgi:hypothetical protein
MNICLPAKLYFIVTVICCIWSYLYFRNDYKKNNKILLFDLSIDILALIFFTWLLNYLCISNYKNASWFLFIIYLIMSITTIYIIKSQKLSYFEAKGIRP